MPPTNPYLNRLPIHRPEEFFGRRQDVYWLLERILYDQPQCCSITGLRRIGKSSLLRFLAHPEGARRRFPAFFDQVSDRLLLVYVDLSLLSPGRAQPDEESTERVETAMLAHLLRALDRVARSELSDELYALIRDVRPDSDAGWHVTLEALEETIARLEDKGFRIVFLLDELDVLVMLPDRFAQALRALVMEHNVGYVTASLHPLYELLIEGRTSPLYNLFSTRPLALLERTEARALLVEPARALGVRWSDALTEAVLDAVGGHPDLVKMAASRLWELWQERGEEPAAENVFDALRPDAHGLFTSFWKHLEAEERNLVAALASGQGRGDPLRLRALQQRALLCESAGEPCLFSPLFAEWARQQPEAPERDDDLRLDGRWLFVYGKKQQLTPTEAKLAELLLLRRGQTVSREALQEAIWDEVDPTSKALDTTVQRLREKIEEDRANPRWLITVRGEGYAFR